MCIIDNVNFMSTAINVRLEDYQMKKINDLVEQGMKQSDAIKFIIDAYNPIHQNLVKKISAVNQEGDILDTVNKMLETYKRFGGIYILPKDTYGLDELREKLKLKEHSKEWQTLSLRDISTVHYYKWKNLS